MGRVLGKARVVAHGTVLSLTKEICDQSRGISRDKATGGYVAGVWEESMAVAALVAFLCSLLLTPAVAAIAWRLGAVSHPDGGRRRQPRSTPLWGGLAVLIGLYAGAAVASGAGVIATEDATWTAAILLSAGIICLLGCYDDARAISASSKLAGQLLAIAPLLLAGFHAERLLVFGLEVELGWLGVPLTAAWLPTHAPVPLPMANKTP